MNHSIPVPYLSPLRISQNFPNLVVYHCSRSGEYVGRVYKRGDLWFLSSKYWSEWAPVEVFSKYGGFLLLNKLHNNRSGYEK